MVLTALMAWCINLSSWWEEGPGYGLSSSSSSNWSWRSSRPDLPLCWEPRGARGPRPGSQYVVESERRSSIPDSTRSHSGASESTSSQLICSAGRSLAAAPTTTRRRRGRRRWCLQWQYQVSIRRELVLNCIVWTEQSSLIRTRSGYPWMVFTLGEVWGVQTVKYQLTCSMDTGNVTTRLKLRPAR